MSRLSNVEPVTDGWQFRSPRFVYVPATHGPMSEFLRVKWWIASTQNEQTSTLSNVIQEEPRHAEIVQSVVPVEGTTTSRIVMLSGPSEPLFELPVPSRMPFQVIVLVGYVSNTTSRWSEATRLPRRFDNRLEREAARRSGRAGGEDGVARARPLVGGVHRRARGGVRVTAGCRPTRAGAAVWVDPQVGKPRRGAGRRGDGDRSAARPIRSGVVRFDSDRKPSPAREAPKGEFRSSRLPDGRSVAVDAVANDAHVVSRPRPAERDARLLEGDDLEVRRRGRSDPVPRYSGCRGRDAQHREAQ